MQNSAIASITEITGIPVKVKEDLEAAAEQQGISLNDRAWTWALALVKAAGGSPSADVLALAEREKRGEITTKDIIKYLDKKYKVNAYD